jgi:hypothetical protein
MDRQEAAAHTLLAASQTHVGNTSGGDSGDTVDGDASSGRRGHRAAAAVPRALVIDGPSLLTAFADPTGAAPAALLAFATRCRAVVACRVSPDQKRAVVRWVKQGVAGVRTLAIGDGANDVAMIQVPLSLVPLSLTYLIRSRLPPPPRSLPRRSLSPDR